jgi:hypothetical protein
MLREAGALEIHVRISSPPVKWPCYYGIDFASRAELIAAGLETEEIRRSIGADSLGYVSMEGLIAATTIAEDKLCTACFSGKYPIQIPADLSAGKNLLRSSKPLRIMSTYSQAGVDIDAGDLAVQLMKEHLKKARRPEVVGDIGGFAGLFDASALKKFNRPLLATSTDGVGTKTEIARLLGKYDTIGEDLVAMVVDDLSCLRC